MVPGFSAFRPIDDPTWYKNGVETSEAFPLSNGG